MNRQIDTHVDKVQIFKTKISMYMATEVETGIEIAIEVDIRLPEIVTAHPNTNTPSPRSLYFGLSPDLHAVHDVIEKGQDVWPLLSKASNSTGLLLRNSNKLKSHTCKKPDCLVYSHIVVTSENVP